MFALYTLGEAFKIVPSCLRQRLGVPWGLRERSTCAKPSKSVVIGRLREEPRAVLTILIISSNSTTSRTSQFLQVHEFEFSIHFSRSSKRISSRVREKISVFARFSPLRTCGPLSQTPQSAANNSGAKQLGRVRIFNVFLSILRIFNHSESAHFFTKIPEKSP